MTAKQRRDVLRAPDRRSQKGKRDAAILACLSHGLRAGEVANLKVSHVLPDGDRLRLRFPTAKTGRIRTVTLEPRAARVLRAWLDYRQPRLWVFTEGSPDHKRGVHHVTTRTIQRICKRHGQAVGHPDLHPHRLRHTAATLLVHGTSDIWKTAQYLGHSVQTCARYYAGYATRDADACADALASAS